MHQSQVAAGNRLADPDDLERFTFLYRRHVGEVYALMHHYARNHFEAEDLTAEVFERALKYFGSYNSQKSAARTWLFAIAHNVTRKHAHLQKGRLEEYLEGTDIDADDGPLLNSLATDFDLKQIVTDALDELRQTERHVVDLRFIAGLSCREVGKVVGRPEAHVRVILHRSLKKIAKRLT